MAVLDRIEMDITEGPRKAVVGLDGSCLEGRLEDAADMAIGTVVVFGIAVHRVLRELAGRMLAVLPDDEMVMVRHEAPGDQFKIQVGGNSAQVAGDIGVIDCFMENVLF